MRNHQTRLPSPLEGEGRVGGNSPGTHVIVLGNSKGGTGKSTTAMHIAAGLLYRGFPSAHSISTRSRVRSAATSRTAPASRAAAARPCRCRSTDGGAG